MPSIEEIELAIMCHNDFNFRQNLIVFRVSDFSNVVNHECDCLVMTKSGYLSEIEIKRSYSDFLSDFKKKHKHDDERIKNFYYCVHENFYEKVLNKLIELNLVPSGIYTYNDDCYLSCKIGHSKIYNQIVENNGKPKLMYSYGRKLFLEEKYQLARLGAMRYKNMTEKIIKNKNNS